MEPEGAGDVCRSLEYSRTGHIGRVTLRRPEKLNALNPSMLRALRHLGERLLKGPSGELRCLVVAGEGSGFCAGLDVIEGIDGIVAAWG